ncbi:MAG TPA: DDE-type integrase/transposase/recombinase [Clostridiaceae bacterium]|nr:DDE-type integrase/transposase/recombinase [Clostridiaceae bacterium]
MRNLKKAEETATQRAMLLAPLLSDGLDRAMMTMLRKRIGEETGLSERTLRRYLKDYKEKGFEGLKPRERTLKDRRRIPEEILEEAVHLRREVPGRSVSEIIRILEWEGRIRPNELKRSTLQEKLQERGYSSRHMAMYAGGGIATRRFQKRSRNKLWHSDIKYGCFLPIGPGGKPQQVYAVSFLDDATRMVLHAEFYPSLEKVIVEDCFRKAVLKHGIPEQVYFDNGKQYRTKWMTRACAKMGIRLIFARPYSPEGTGKIERFNRNIDRFLGEYQVDGSVKTLQKMNSLFSVWLEECYQNRSHSELNDLTPVEAYNLDPRPIRHLAPEVVADAFLHSEPRKVDKSGCISFNGEKYETGLAYVGCTVDVIFDPSDIREVTIEYQGCKPFRAGRLIIGEKVSEKPKVPEHMTLIKPTASRLLDAAGGRNEKRQEKNRTTAISFRSMRNGGSDDV